MFNGQVFHSVNQHTYLYVDSNRNCERLLAEARNEQHATVMVTLTGRTTQLPIANVRQSCNSSLRVFPGLG